MQSQLNCSSDPITAVGTAMTVQNILRLNALYTKRLLLTVIFV